MTAKRRKLTDAEKSRLKNKDQYDVPLLPLRRAAREMSKGNFNEADRLWNLVKDEDRKNK